MIGNSDGPRLDDSGSCLWPLVDGDKREAVNQDLAVEMNAMLNTGGLVSFKEFKEISENSSGRQIRYKSTVLICTEIIIISSLGIVYLKLLKLV